MLEREREALRREREELERQRAANRQLQALKAFESAFKGPLSHVDPIG